MGIRQWLKQDRWRREGFSVEGLTHVLAGMFNALAGGDSMRIECHSTDDGLLGGTAIIANRYGEQFEILRIAEPGIAVGEDEFAAHDPQALVEGIKAAVDSFERQFPPLAGRNRRYVTVRGFSDNTAQVRYYFRHERRQGKPPAIRRQHLLAVTDGKVLACIHD